MAKKEYPLGQFLKSLREQKSVSLLDVQKATGVSNAYISQLETGTRRRLPTPERLRALGDFYNVSMKELMQKAGYYEAGEVKESFKDQIDHDFLHVINEPQFQTGRRIRPDQVNTDIKRFVIEMHSYCVRKSSFFPTFQAAGRSYGKNNTVKSLRWHIVESTRDSYQSGKKILVRYRVRVTCAESEGKYDPEKIYRAGAIEGTEKIIQKVEGEATLEDDMGNVLGYNEAFLLLRTADQALRNAFPKIKGTNWASVIKPEKWIASE